MKLLFITDSLFILSKFSSKNDLYYFGDIQVDCIYLKNSEDIEKVKSILAERRYHLILSLTKSDFQGEYIQNEIIVNAINNYWTTAHETTNIVNRTTSYFNVFLEIPKAVSANESIDSLQRLDVISPFNYLIGKICIDTKSNFYILNYQSSFPLEEITDLFTKLE